MNREPEILRLDGKSKWAERYLERAEQRGSMHAMTRAARFLTAVENKAIAIASREVQRYTDKD